MSLKYKSWLLLGGIFVVGAVSGAALTAGLGPRFALPPMPHSPEAHDMNRHWIAHLTHELSLTTDQQAKIEPILADAESKLQSLHHDEVERGSQIFKAADDQIAALLTPDQKLALQKMQKEREKMFSGHVHSWGAPHEGSGDSHHHGETEDSPPPPPPPGSPPPPAAPAAPTH